MVKNLSVNCVFTLATQRKSLKNIWKNVNLEKQYKKILQNLGQKNTRIIFHVVLVCIQYAAINDFTPVPNCILEKIVRKSLFIVCNKRLNSSGSIFKIRFLWSDYQHNNGINLTMHRNVTFVNKVSTQKKNVYVIMTILQVNIFVKIIVKLIVTVILKLSNNVLRLYC